MTGKVVWVVLHGPTNYIPGGNDSSNESYSGERSSENEERRRVKQCNEGWASRAKKEWPGRNKGRDRHILNYTKRNQPITVVLNYLEECNLVEQSELSMEWSDCSEYCTFHHSIGHGTLECHNMKNVIKELVRKGTLDKFIKKDRKKLWNIFNKDNKNDKKPNNNNPEKKPEKPRILIIYGGP